ncbi:MAG: type III-B CRISPR module-associated protein Cmr5 [Desulfitobacteriaceae bacterium]
MAVRRQTLVQTRARETLEIINQMKNKKDKTNRNETYAQLVAGFAATVLMNGLGQALATLVASGKEHEKLLYAQLQGWLCGGFDQAPYSKGKDLLEALMEGDRKSYLRAQVEALAWLEWLKKFATAYLKKEKP